MFRLSSYHLKSVVSSPNIAAFMAPKFSWFNKLFKFCHINVHMKIISFFITSCETNLTCWLSSHCFDGTRKEIFIASNPAASERSPWKGLIQPVPGAQEKPSFKFWFISDLQGLLLSLLGTHNSTTASLGLHGDSGTASLWGSHATLAHPTLNLGQVPTPTSVQCLRAESGIHACGSCNTQSGKVHCQPRC